MAWLSGWNKRIKVTVDCGNVDANLTHFPVLLYLSTSSGSGSDDVSAVFDEVGANSKKIAVTKDDGTTQCYVQIEKWDLGNEKAWLWTSLSSLVLSSSVDTILYLYFDNSRADNDAYVAVKDTATARNVWNAQYKTVQDMADASSPIVGSTTNGLDGTEGGSPTYQQAGQIAYAVYLTKLVGDGFNFGNPAALRPAHVTLSFWTKTTDYTRSLNGGIAYGAVFGDVNAYGYKVNFHESEAHLHISDGSSHYGLAVAIGDNLFHHWALTFDEQVVRAYKDGAEAAGSPVTAAVSISYPSGGADVFMIGMRADGQYGLGGTIDDVRVSSANRGGAWIKAENHAGRDTLIKDYAAMELYSAPRHGFTMFQDPGIV